MPALTDSEAEKPKRSVGRPLGSDKYPGDEEALQAIIDYLSECEKSLDVPIKAGLAVHMGVCKDTINKWGQDHPDFLVALGNMMACQETGLVSGGLKSTYNSTIAKLLLSSNHGYKDKSDLTTGGEPIQAPVVVRNANEPVQDKPE